jgi:hypothetical protein
MAKRVISIGLHPDVCDYSLYPGLTKERLIAGLQAQEKQLREMGFDIKMLLVDLGETAENVAREALQAVRYDVVLIGAGIRFPPQYLLLFERMVNVVHERAPQARICFNTQATDTADAILRWAKP